MPPPDSFFTSEIALVLSLCAIIFTIFSFWWLNARRGKVIAIGPQYVFGQFKSQKLAIQLPLVLQNTGPQSIVISGFAVRFLETQKDKLIWVGFSTDPLDGEFSFKKPVVLKGFDAIQTILYFQREAAENLLVPHKVQLQAVWSGKNTWRALTSFTMPASKDGWNEKFSGIGIDIVGGVETREDIG
ncbi:MAG: hypothetical protein WAW75_05300 [Gallionella sp.]